MGHPGGRGHGVCFVGDVEDLDHRAAPQCDDRGVVSEPPDVDPQLDR